MIACPAFLPPRIDLTPPALHSPRVLRHLPFAIFMLLPVSAGAETRVVKSPPPDWVLIPEYEIPAAVDPSGGSVRHVAVDFQNNLEESAEYNHYARKINTVAGVEENSQLSVDFQPEYQTLTWHTLQVIRDGVAQDRLPAAEFELIRQEKGLDRQLYDGEITAHAILRDIRPGDTIVYAFTITGDNPIFKDRAHTFLRTGYSSEVGYVRRRFLWDASKRTLRWRLEPASADALVHTEKGAGELDSLLFEKRAIPKIDIEDNVPPAVTTYPFIEVSDYASWDEFGDWALSIYNTGEALPEEIRTVCEEIRAKGLPPDETAIAALRWVQGNVRYLGSFMGEHTHVPYTLAQICERRFGDCKDKAMLTTAMLRHLGFDAAPALVNTSECGGIAEYFPGFCGFDHLIVHLKHDGADHWLDPTRAYQRGNLRTSYAPDYGFAFVIRPGAAALTPVKPTGYAASTSSITESFVIPDMSGNATLRVRTVATGADADNLRRTFSTDPLSEIEENYRKFYESDYPGITVAEPMTFTDDEAQNSIVLTESYSLTGLWQKEKNEGEADQLAAWFYARWISVAATAPADATRKLPYWISHPNSYVHTLEITPPTAWNIPEGKHNRQLPSLDYAFDISTRGGKAIVRFDYRTKADRVMPADFAAYKEAMKLMKDDLYYYLSSPIAQEKKADGVGKSYGFVTAFVMTGLILGLGAGFLIWLWDPAPRPADPGSQRLEGLGGWLVLPIIGCFVLPVMCIYEISTFYTIIDATTFTLFSGLENETMQRVAFAFGSFSSTFTLVLYVLQLMLLFSRRTSFPFLFIFLGIATLLLDVTYLQLSGISSGTGTGIGETDNIVRPIIATVLWSAYMLTSQRVRITFVKTRRARPSTPGSSPPPLPAGYLSGRDEPSASGH